MDSLVTNLLQIYYRVVWKSVAISRTYAQAKPVHTSDNVAKNRDIVAENGDIVAETGDNVAETGNIVFLATMLPDCCRFRLCGRDYGDNVAGFGDNVAVLGDIVAGVDGT